MCRWLVHVRLNRGRLDGCRNDLLFLSLYYWFVVLGVKRISAFWLLSRLQALQNSACLILGVLGTVGPLLAKLTEAFQNVYKVTCAVEVDSMSLFNDFISAFGLISLGKDRHYEVLNCHLHVFLVDSFSHLSFHRFEVHQFRH